MHWTYDEVRALPREVYGVLIEMLNAEHEPDEEPE
jgi:hypothetical protein